MNNKFLYSMTNYSSENSIIGYNITNDNKLVKFGEFKTMGKGTGNPVVDPLVSQGSIAISREANILFTVNAGNNTISVFKIKENGELNLIQAFPSHGIMPVSLSIDSNLLVVANRGNATTPSNICTFLFNEYGCVNPKCYSCNRLSNPTASPASVIVNPATNDILVSELNLNRISIFDICKCCKISCPVVNNSANPGPFPLVSLRNGIILSVEVGGSMITSYKLEGNNTLTTINSVATNGNASCWLSVTPDEKYAYVSNTASGTISIFSIALDGTLAFIKTVQAVATGSSAPIDSTVSSDGKYFAVLIADTGSISLFTIESNGDLILANTLTNTGLPAPGAQGLVIY